MDLVLGLSLTTAALRWVFVAGPTGEGEPIDCGEIDIPAIAAPDADLLVRAVLNPDVVAEGRLRVVGVTATRHAEAAADAVVDALHARGHHDVVPVPNDAAAAALAAGIADITAYDRVLVCIVEPGCAMVAQVADGEVTVEHIDRPPDGRDALEMTSRVLTVVDALDPPPDAMFAVGSDDVGVIVSALEGLTEAPVFSAAEADLALARGVALVAARAIDVPRSHSATGSAGPARLR